MRRLLLVCLLAAPVIARAAENAGGAYSQAQAARGAKVYAENCATCHGGSLEGMDVTPPLAGPRFLANWSGQTVGALVERIHTTMPQDDPGSLGLAATRDVAAHILATNGYPAGANELPADAAALDTIKLGAPPAK